MIRFVRIFFILLLILSVDRRLDAQVTTGAPPFNSFQYSGNETINLGNLNVHINIPVFSKTGRGLNFNYQLGYDTSTYEIIHESTGYYWALNTNAMLQGPGAFAVTGRITYSQTLVQTCTEGKEYEESSFIYTDPNNTPHPFNGATYYVTGTGCGTSGPGFNAVATDGSGYTLTVASSGKTGSLSDKMGTNICALGVDFVTCAAGPYLIDRNGNEITEAPSGDIGFSDTTSSTSPTLTYDYQSSNLTTISYTAPSGAPASYSVKYSSYTVQSNFQCSNINEYGPLSNYLVSEIDLPDGSKYLFAYEPTTGYPANTTGRLASITYPTGGTISYKYTGANDGITCADGSTASLQRTTPDTGAGYWTYAQAQGTKPASTTTVTDPTGSNTVIQYQRDIEVERQIYQGSINSSNLLLTSTTCYVSTSPPNCTETLTPVAPISQQNKTTQLPGSSNLTSEQILKFDGYGNVTEEDDYDYGPGSPGPLLKKISTSYASLTNNIHALPSQVTVTNGSGTTVSQTTYSYDQTAVVTSSGTPQHVSITGSRGNLTSINLYSSTSAYLTKSMTYYDTGNIDVLTDVDGEPYTYLYACGNSYPTQVSVPYDSISTSMTWNCNGGVQLTSTDANSQTITTTYNDPYFWRPNAVTDQESNETTYTYVVSGGQRGSIYFEFVLQQQQLDS